MDTHLVFFAKPNFSANKSLLIRFFLAGFVAIMLSGCLQQSEKSNSSELPPDANRIGYAYFTEQCASCHGKQGEGSDQAPSLINCSSCNNNIATLEKRIQDTMPLGSSTDCREDCAKHVAEYILVTLNQVPLAIIEEQRAKDNDIPTIIAVDDQTDSQNNDATKDSEEVEQTDEQSEEQGSEVLTESPPAQLYMEMCQSCHGSDGKGSGDAPSLHNCTSCTQGETALSDLIADSMPLANSDACDADCSMKLANYILTTFNSSTSEVGEETDNAATDENTTTEEISESEETTEPEIIATPETTPIRSIGHAYYLELCIDCHGNNGESSISAPSLVNCDTCQQTPTTLKQRIIDTMPFGNAASCNEECAQQLAEYILVTLNQQDPTSLYFEENSTPEPPPEITEPVEEDPLLEILATGHSAYMEKCSGCHGTQGMGSNGGPSLISCASCGEGLNALIKRITNTMPLNNADLCDANCAEPIAHYILENFNADSIASTTILFNGTIQLPPLPTLRKATLNLAGRLPTETETELVETSGEEGLKQALDSVLNEEAFYSRLTEIYNDNLLLDKYLPHQRAIDLLHSDDYPQKWWIRDLGLCTDNCTSDTEVNEKKRFYRLRDEVNDAIAREVYELIRYILQNNLPFYDFLTANYTMVNYYSARAYGVENQLEFRKLNIDDPNYPEDSKLLNDNAYVYDPNDFQPIQLGNIPHSGLLTSHVFLNRFPTTKTNRNRHRSKTVYKLFLDTDILTIGDGRPDATQATNSQTPTLDNPSCTVCHNVMDPIAATFQNWDIRGRYRPTRLFNGWYTDMLPRGFNGEDMTLAGNVDSSLQWLGQQIINDPRFAYATVKALFKGFTGFEPLKNPIENDADSATSTIFKAQQTFFTKLANDLINSNFDIRLPIKSLITSHWFRTQEMSVDTDSTLVNNISTVRLLTPEMLDRKIKTTLGVGWEKYTNNRLRPEVNNNFNILYGGIDSDNITQRLAAPNGLMIAVQTRMANEVSCQAVPLDFYRSPGDRILFPYVQIDTSLLEPNNEEVVKINISLLHERLWGSNESSEIEESFTLLKELQLAGLADMVQDTTWGNRHLDWSCGIHQDPNTGDELVYEEKVYKDDQYIIRAWMGLVNYLISDFKYLYE